MKVFIRYAFLAITVVICAELIFAFSTGTIRTSDISFQSITHSVQTALTPQGPCSPPVEYSMGAFDARFGITKDEALKDVQDAVAVWEKAAGRKLFTYDPNGALKINFVYDERQQVTNTLKQVGGTIESDRAQYDALKSRYDSFVSSFQKLKSSFDSQVADYQTNKTAYEIEVAKWNAKGGAPADQYAALERQRNALNQEAAALNQTQTALNSLVDNINSVLALLNDKAQKLNLQVTTFNETAQSTGEEFNEGEYILDQTGTRINIYQFDSKEKLLRVLEHEFGHALGLEHVSDPNAIMYRLNNGKGTSLTKDDILELMKVCGS